MLNAVQISAALGRLVTVTPELTSKGNVTINQSKELAHYQGKVGNCLLSPPSRLVRPAGRGVHTLAARPALATPPPPRLARGRSGGHPGPTAARVPSRRGWLAAEVPKWQATRVEWPEEVASTAPWRPRAKPGPWGQSPPNHGAGGPAEPNLTCLPGTNPPRPGPSRGLASRRPTSPQGPPTTPAAQYTLRPAAAFPASSGPTERRTVKAVLRSLRLEGMALPGGDTHVAPPGLLRRGKLRPSGQR